MGENGYRFVGSQWMTDYEEPTVFYYFEREIEPKEPTKPTVVVATPEDPSMYSIDPDARVLLNENKRKSRS